MGTDDAELWKQVDRLLRRRPGWRFQAVASPGAPPVWCFGPEHEPELSVTVTGGSICVYVAAADYDLSLNNADELESWLAALWPGTLEEPRESRRDRLGRGGLFRWE
jgi:hypothetical protein